MFSKDVPRKGNVDRNCADIDHQVSNLDVPRKGNVDRNINVHLPLKGDNVTFPARGTWIEMFCMVSRI